MSFKVGDVIRDVSGLGFLVKFGQKFMGTG